MPTITIDLPDNVSVTAFEAQVNAMARALGLKPQYAGHRRIKLIALSPNAVSQKIRPRLVAVPKTHVPMNFDGPGAA